MGDVAPTARIGVIVGGGATQSVSTGDKSFHLAALNLDADEVIERIKSDQWTPRDATYNEFIRSIYSRGGDSMVEDSNILEIIAEKNDIEYKKPDEGGGRFASAQKRQASAAQAPVAAAPAANTVTFTNDQLQDLIKGIVAGVKADLGS